MHFLRAVTLVVFVVILNAVTSDMHEYISNIPSDVGNSVNNAWNNIMRAIKRPVRIRRLGRTGRTKTPRTTAADLTTRYLIKLTQPQQQDTTLAPSTTTKPLTKLMIPVLLQPSWRLRFDWRKSNDVINSTGSLKEQETKSNPYPSRELTSNVNKMSEDNDSQHYGNLFFV